MITNDQYISVRETAQILGISEQKVMNLLEEEKLQAYRIAGQFLRFKKKEILKLKSGGEVVAENTHYPYTFTEKFRDFFYFNDFYLVALGVILFFLYLIFKT